MMTHTHTNATRNKTTDMNFNLCIRMYFWPRSEGAVFNVFCYPYFLNVWSMKSRTVMQHIAQIYESYELTKAIKSDVSMKTILWYNV